MNLSGASKVFMIAAVFLAAMVLIQPVMAGEKEVFGGAGGNLITSVPRSMSYQGILKDSGGDPVTDSVYSMTFRIYDAESGGTSEWTETLPCTTSAGYFTAVFSNVNIPFDEDYWLELEVGGEIFDPRQKMNMAGYAAVSDTADYAWNTAGGNAWVITGNAGTTPGTHFVGTTDDQALEFHVNNNRALRLEPNEQLGNPTTANVIGGSWENTVTAGVAGATICGGGSTGDYINQVTYSWGFVGGGNGNTAAENAATVGGGAVNLASGSGSTVSGGYADSATAYAAAVGGGYGNIASGQYSTVTGGHWNTASGHYSFAAGRRAKAIHDGAFVWADNTNADFTSGAHGQFNVRASGGTRIFSNSGLTAGVTLSAGASSWSSVSDSTLKRNIRPVDGDDILEKISKLPISRWSYKAQDESIEHIGPMAQDFYEAFGLGEDERYISTIDPSGVALAGVKELLKKIEALEQRNAELERRITELDNR